MQVNQIFQALGEQGFDDVFGTLTVTKLKTYKLYETLKARAHLPKLNVAGLKKVRPRFWERLVAGDEDLAGDLAQAVLISNLDMIVEVLDFLEVPHHDGFFEKDFDATEILKDDWRDRAYKNFQGKYPGPLLVFYLNHLAMETTKAEDLFTPADAK